MAFPIDCALEQIAATEKHLGIDKKITRDGLRRWSVSSSGRQVVRPDRRCSGGALDYRSP
jgi:hypothetical protein